MAERARSRMDGVPVGPVVRRERNGVMTGVAAGKREASWQWGAWLGSWQVGLFGGAERAEEGFCEAAAGQRGAPPAGSSRASGVAITLVSPDPKPPRPSRRSAPGKRWPVLVAHPVGLVQGQGPDSARDSC